MYSAREIAMFLKCFGRTSVALAAALAVSGCYAAKPDTTLQIGDAAPDWSGLTGTDGKAHAYPTIRMLNLWCWRLPATTAPWPRPSSRG